MDVSFFSLEELAKMTEATLVGDPAHQIQGVESLEEATSSHASFLENPRYEQALRQSAAGVIFVPRSYTPLPGKNYLLVDSPSLAFQKVIELFLSPPLSGFSSIHPTALVHPTAKIAPGVILGPYVVVDQGTTIGENTILAPFVSVGPSVTIGRECHLHPHVVVAGGCCLGNKVVIQAGAVIGSSGFGYATTNQGKHVHLQQLGNVVLEDEVEIGANTTIDRARFKTTKIGRGTKVDNLVQIAHQVELGEDNLIVSQVGIAGSTKTGKRVVIGGQVGVVGHIEIGDGVMLAARSGASKSIAKPGIYSGAPAMPIKEFNEHFVYLRNIKKLTKKVEALEKKLSDDNSSTNA